MLAGIEPRLGASRGHLNTRRALVRLTKDDKEVIKSCLRTQVAVLVNLERSSFESGQTKKGGFPLLLASYKRVLAKLSQEAGA